MFYQVEKRKDIEVQFTLIQVVCGRETIIELLHTRRTELEYKTEIPRPVRGF